MKALFDFIKLKVQQALNAIKWPVWYFGGMTILCGLLSFEVLDTWSAWAYLMLGFIVWAYKKTNA